MNEIETLKKQKDGAYWERNQLVSALSKVFPAHLAKHPEEDKEWDDDWRTIVVIKIPVELCKEEAGRRYEMRHAEYPRDVHFNGTLGAGATIDMEPDFEYYQLSWHIHDAEISMFDHLTYKEFQWDGHSNEDKYRRLRLLKKTDPQNAHYAADRKVSHEQV